MPNNKNAMTRYALIDRMLANRYHAFSIQDITNELADMLPEFGQDPVTKRCVEKDLNYLESESPFNVEIEEYWVDASNRNGKPYRKRCVRYLDPTFSIFHPKLTDDEKTILSSALDTLGSFEGLENFEWLNDLKDRLQLEQREAIVSFSKNLLSNSTLMARLFTAIRERSALRLRYHTFRDPDVRCVDISPHMLKEYNNRWFLIASACDTGRILTFPLDRIDDFSYNSVQEYLPAPDDFIERYEDIIGVTYDEDAPLEEIIFWISDYSKDYMATKPIHGSQTQLKGEMELQLRNKYPDLKGGLFFRIRCKRNYELIRELSAYGPALIVLSPQEISREICLRARNIEENYKKLIINNE